MSRPSAEKPQNPPPLIGGGVGSKSRWLVFENSFSPAVGSPRRPIKKSPTQSEKSNTERARLYGKPGAFFEVLSNLNHKALNAASSRARYTGACEKGERDEEGEPARLTRAPAHRKLESQIVLPPPPQPPPG